ncbi:unnamed protein product [marine sediment metagenome]|uniref:Uncharacterized protein n=1 Tax=marine sediment metagenome TaxID=412755 RepID=X1QQY6_9ZZZZ
MLRHRDLDAYEILAMFIANKENIGRDQARRTLRLPDGAGHPGPGQRDKDNGAGQSGKGVRDKWEEYSKHRQLIERSLT